MTRPALILGAGILGAAGIAARAYEAHGILALPDITEPRLRDFSSATEILLVHALAMLALVGASDAIPRIARWTGIIFTAGVVLFAGPLMSYALFGSRGFIILAPFGGGLLIIGWILLAAGGALAFLAGGNSR